MSKRLVVCLDGTGNEPESGKTNVRRLYDMLVEDPSQVNYYDPGVGTIAADTAGNRYSQTLSRWGGNLFGHGVEENVGQAYSFISENWAPGDLISIFGFSRGAYTARALAGILRTIGPLRRQLRNNLTEYALKLYTDEGLPDTAPSSGRDEWWGTRVEWQESFARPGWPDRFEWNQVHFLGLWDTVKFVGTLNKRAQWQEARWPFTRKVANVTRIRHAISIDERRKKYEEYRLKPELVADPARDASEVWFAGVHSDVGGTFPDDERLADITLKWMIDEATDVALRVDGRTGNPYPDQDLRVLKIDAQKYTQTLEWGKHKPRLGDQLHDDYCLGNLHPAGKSWWITGPGWRTRPIAPTDTVHESVHKRMQLDSTYKPSIPDKRARN